MLAQPRQATRPRIQNPRTAKHAAQRRLSRKSRARYTGLVRFCASLLVVLCAVMLYVMLTARLTSLNYAVAKAEHERAVLQAQTARLDDRLAVLQSDDRLAKIAAKLQMRDPQQFALVTLPAPVTNNDRSHVALLTTITSLFGAK